MKRVTNEEIDKHDLLDAETRKQAREMRNAARAIGVPLTMHDVALGVLRRAARLDAANTGLCERDLKHAAVLYVYEALKACDVAIVKEWTEFDEMLRSLEYLAGDLP